MRKTLRDALPPGIVVRFAPVALIVLVGGATGWMLARAAEVLRSRSGLEGLSVQPGEVLVDTMVAALLGPPALMLGLALGLATAVAWLWPEILDVRMRIQALLNAGILAYGLTPLFVLLRPGIVALAVVGLLFVAFLVDRGRVGRPRHLLWMLLALGASSLLMLLRPLLGSDAVSPGIQFQTTWDATKFYWHAFLVYYVVARNGWGLREIDRFFGVLAIVGLVLAAESLAAFYLSIELFTVLGENSLNAFGQFQSALAASFHVVGRLGMVLLFASLYFLARGRSKLWWGGAVSGLLLVGSTLSRQTYAATALGLLFVFVMTRRAAGLKSHRASLANWATFPVAALVVGVSIIGAFQFGAAERADLADDETFNLHISHRIAKVARAVDVLIYTQFVGTGPGLYPHYAGSSSVPPVASRALLPLVGLDYDELLRFVVPAGELTEGGMGSTLHNQWMDVVVDWGIAGVAIVGLIVASGYTLFRRAIALERRAPSPASLRPFWILMGMSFAIGVSVTVTSKVDLPWLYAILCVAPVVALREARDRIEGP